MAKKGKEMPKEQIITLFDKEYKEIYAKHLFSLYE